MDEKALRRMIASPRTRIGRDCAADSCMARTREGKPLCPDHILEMPYVKAVLAGLNNRADQVAGLGKYGPDPLILIDEVVQMLLQLGGLSLEGAAKNLSIDRKQMGHLAQIMKRRKMITLFKNKRGLWVMELL